MPVAPWPAAELETLSACPVCSSAERELLYQDLIDNVFNCAPGRWSSWLCSNCGSAYLSPRPSPASIHLAYASYYTHRGVQPRRPYEALGPLHKLRRWLANGYLNRRFFLHPEAPATRLGLFLILAARPYKNAVDRNYRHMPRPTEDGTLLDVGCGDGAFLELARSCGWNVMGVDPDPNAVANCRSRDLNVRLGGIEQFDDERERFDVMTLAHVLEHAHDPIALITACRRLLKPGGQIWIETPNIDSLGHRRYARNWRGLEPPRHLVLFNARSLRASLVAAGFARVETMPDTSPLLFMTVASEALKRGMNAESEIRLPFGLKVSLRIDQLRQSLSPACREFLTVVALKR